MRVVVAIAVIRVILMRTYCGSVDNEEIFIMTGHGGCHILLLGVMATASPTMPGRCLTLDTMLWWCGTRVPALQQYGCFHYHGCHPSFYHVPVMIWLLGRAKRTKYVFLGAFAIHLLPSGTRDIHVRRHVVDMGSPPSTTQIMCN
jgi:hypothetical protein